MLSILKNLLLVLILLLGLMVVLPLDLYADGGLEGCRYYDNQDDYEVYYCNKGWFSSAPSVYGDKVVYALGIGKKDDNRIIRGDVLYMYRDTQIDNSGSNDHNELHWLAISEHISFMKPGDYDGSGSVDYNLYLNSYSGLSVYNAEISGLDFVPRLNVKFNAPNTLGILFFQAGDDLALKSIEFGENFSYSGNWSDSPSSPASGEYDGYLRSYFRCYMLGADDCVLLTNADLIAKQKVVSANDLAHLTLGYKTPTAYIGAIHVADDSGLVLHFDGPSSIQEINIGTTDTHDFGKLDGNILIADDQTQVRTIVVDNPLAADGDVSVLRLDNSFFIPNHFFLNSNHLIDTFVINDHAKLLIENLTSSSADVIKEYENITFRGDGNLVFDLADSAHNENLTVGTIDMYQLDVNGVGNFYVNNLVDLDILFLDNTNFVIKDDADITNNVLNMQLLDATSANLDLTQYLAPVTLNIDVIALKSGSTLMANQDLTINTGTIEIDDITSKIVNIADPSNEVQLTLSADNFLNPVVVEDFDLALQHVPENAQLIMLATNRSALKLLDTADSTHYVYLDALDGSNNAEGDNSLVLNRVDTAVDTRLVFGNIANVNDTLTIKSTHSDGVLDLLVDKVIFLDLQETDYIMDLNINKNGAVEINNSSANFYNISLDQNITNFNITNSSVTAYTWYANSIDYHTDKSDDVLFIADYSDNTKLGQLFVKNNLSVVGPSGSKILFNADTVTFGATLSLAHTKMTANTLKVDYVSDSNIQITSSNLDVTELNLASSSTKNVVINIADDSDVKLGNIIVNADTSKSGKLNIDTQSSVILNNTADYTFANIQLKNNSSFNAKLLTAEVLDVNLGSSVDIDHLAFFAANAGQQLFKINDNSSALIKELDTSQTGNLNIELAKTSNLEIATLKTGDNITDYNLMVKLQDNSKIKLTNNNDPVDHYINSIVLGKSEFIEENKNTVHVDTIDIGNNSKIDVNNLVMESPANDSANITVASNSYLMVRGKFSVGTAVQFDIGGAGTLFSAKSIDLANDQGELNVTIGNSAEFQVTEGSAIINNFVFTNNASAEFQELIINNLDIKNTGVVGVAGNLTINNSVNVDGKDSKLVTAQNVTGSDIGSQFNINNNGLVEFNNKGDITGLNITVDNAGSLKVTGNLINNAEYANELVIGKDATVVIEGSINTAAPAIINNAENIFDSYSVDIHDNGALQVLHNATLASLQQFGDTATLSVSQDLTVNGVLQLQDIQTSTNFNVTGVFSVNGIEPRNGYNRSYNSYIANSNLSFVNEVTLNNVFLFTSDLTFNDNAILGGSFAANGYIDSDINSKIVSNNSLTIDTQGSDVYFDHYVIESKSDFLLKGNMFLSNTADATNMFANIKAQGNLIFQDVKVQIDGSIDAIDDSGYNLYFIGFDPDKQTFVQVSASKHIYDFNQIYISDNVSLDATSVSIKSSDGKFIVEGDNIDINLNDITVNELRLKGDITANIQGKIDVGGQFVLENVNNFQITKGVDTYDLSLLNSTMTVSQSAGSSSVLNVQHDLSLNNSKLVLNSDASLVSDSILLDNKSSIENLSHLDTSNLILDHESSLDIKDEIQVETIRLDHNSSLKYKTGQSTELGELYMDHGSILEGEGNGYLKIYNMTLNNGSSVSETINKIEINGSLNINNAVLETSEIEIANSVVTIDVTNNVGVDIDGTSKLSSGINTIGGGVKLNDVTIIPTLSDTFHIKYTDRSVDDCADDDRCIIHNMIKANKIESSNLDLKSDFPDWFDLRIIYTTDFVTGQEIIGVGIIRNSHYVDLVGASDYAENIDILEVASNLDEIVNSGDENLEIGILVSKLDQNSGSCNAANMNYDSHCNVIANNIATLQPVDNANYMMNIHNVSLSLLSAIDLERSMYFSFEMDPSYEPFEEDFINMNNAWVKVVSNFGSSDDRYFAGERNYYGDVSVNSNILFGYNIIDNYNRDNTLAHNWLVFGNVGVGSLNLNNDLASSDSTTLGGGTRYQLQRDQYTYTMSGITELAIYSGNRGYFVNDAINTYSNSVGEALLSVELQRDFKIPARIPSLQYFYTKPTVYANTGLVVGSGYDETGSDSRLHVDGFQSFVYELGISDQNTLLVIVDDYNFIAFDFEVGLFYRNYAMPETYAYFNDLNDYMMRFESYNRGSIGYKSNIAIGYLINQVDLKLKYEIEGQSGAINNRVIFSANYLF